MVELIILFYIVYYEELILVLGFILLVIEGVYFNRNAGIRMNYYLLY